MSQSLGRGTVTTAEAFWYVVGCVAFGANYFAKLPVRRALMEYGLLTVSRWERFWYGLMNIIGAGYFAKVIVKKALSEIQQS